MSTIIDKPTSTPSASEIMRYAPDMKIPCDTFTFDKPYTLKRGRTVGKTLDDYEATTWQELVLRQTDEKILDEERITVPQIHNKKDAGIGLDKSIPFSTYAFHSDVEAPTWTKEFEVLGLVPTSDGSHVPVLFPVRTAIRHQVVLCDSDPSLYQTKEGRYQNSQADVRYGKRRETCQGSVDLKGASVTVSFPTSARAWCSASSGPENTWSAPCVSLHRALVDQPQTIASSLVCQIGKMADITRHNQMDNEGRFSYGDMEPLDTHVIKCLTNLGVMIQFAQRTS